MVAHIEGKRVMLIPQTLDPNEFSFRLLLSRPDFGRFHSAFQIAHDSKDTFAMQFYLDRALSLSTTSRSLQLRYQIQPDVRYAARACFHDSSLAKSPYDFSIVCTLAMRGDRLAKRLVAQESLRNAKPQAAIPLLFECMLSRPITSPPVEELLLAQAYLDLNQPDEAKRFYRAATDWLERYEKPIQAMNIVSLCALNTWAGLGEAFAPVDDPRRNPFDWESWHECDVFRAEVERRLRSP